MQRCRAYATDHYRKLQCMGSAARCLVAPTHRFKGPSLGERRGLGASACAPWALTAARERNARSDHSYSSLCQYGRSNQTEDCGYRGRGARSAVCPSAAPMPVQSTHSPDTRVQMAKTQKNKATEGHLGLLKVCSPSQAHLDRRRACSNGRGPLTTSGGYRPRWQSSRRSF